MTENPKTRKSALASALQKMGLIAISSLVAVGSGEAVLRLLTHHPVTSSSNQRKDPILAYTMEPTRHEVDEHGFRNHGLRPDQAEIAVLGDSQAYGWNVEIQNNFPSVLSRMTGRSVYNYGIGSYGVYQYQRILERLPTAGLEAVIVALYPANDLHPAWQLWQSRKGWAQRSAYWMGLARQHGVELPSGNEEQPRRHRHPNWFPRFVYKTAWGSLFRDTVERRVGGSAKVFSFRHGQEVQKDRVRNHADNVDLEHTILRANFEMSKKLVSHQCARLHEAGVDFGILIVPSKERVLHEWAQTHSFEEDEEFVELVSRESMVVNDFIEHFAQSSVPYVDALPVVVRSFESEVSKGKTFYPARDGHPLEAGYQAYAQAALALLRKFEDIRTACGPSE